MNFLQKGGNSGLIKARDKLNSKQLRAISVLHEKVEKGGKINYGEILMEAGYSPNTAKTPQKVFGKPTVKKELELRGLDPESLRKTHEDLLNAFKIDYKYFSIDVPEEDIKSLYENTIGGYVVCTKTYPKKGLILYTLLIPDNITRSAALKLGYKVYPPGLSIDDSIIERSHEKHQELLQKMKDKLMEKKTHL